MRKRIVFDQPGLSLPEPVRPPPADHRCQTPGCRSWASWGFREPGVAALREPVIAWACLEHRANIGDAIYLGIQTESAGSRLKALQHLGHLTTDK